jgi:hypothetical protein
VALLRSPRFSYAVMACVLGVVACGVAVALAGNTPFPPADPLDDLPENVSMVRDEPCATSLIASLWPSTTIQTTTTASPKDCWRIALVKSEQNEDGNQLADRLAQHLTAKGYQFTGVTSGDWRSYLGKLTICGTTVAIDTNREAPNLTPGQLSAAPPGIDPTTGAPTAGAFPPAPAPPRQPVPTDPATGLPGALPTVPSTTLPDPTGSVVVPSFPPDAGPPTVVPPPMSPNLDPSVPIEDALQADPYSVMNYLSGQIRPGLAVVSVQQTHAVVPRAAAGRC